MLPGEEVTFQYHYDWSVQRPNDGDLTDRAINVSFKAGTKDDKLQVKIRMRVIFDFGDEPISVDDDAFMEKYQQAAYARFFEKVSAVLNAMETDWTLPEIALPD